MKKEIHLSTHSIIISCSYCNQQYQTVSASSKNISTGSCSNCNPFYTGSLVSQMNVGTVEKYRQRQKKSEERSK